MTGPTDRRRFLAAAGAGVLGALAGCNGDNSGSGGTGTPGGTGGSGAGGSGGTPTPTATASPTPTPTDKEKRLRNLSRLTETIVDSIVWHGVEYDTVKTQIRIRANQVLGIANQLQEATTVTRNDVEELEDRTTRLATYLRNNLAPYYPIQRERIALNGNNVLVQQVKLAAERGDPQAVENGLKRIKSFYSNYKSDAFFETNYPNGPIYQRLIDRLRRKNTTQVTFEVAHAPSGFFAPVHFDRKPKELNVDSVPQHTHEWPTGHKVAHHVHQFDDIHELSDHTNEPRDRLIHAWSGTGYDILADAAPDFQDVSKYRVSRSDIFGPMSLPERRVSEAYVSVSYMNEPLPNRPNNKDANRDFDSMPIQIQKFESEDAAEQALSDLLSANIFAQGTDTVQKDNKTKKTDLEWQQVFYTKQGNNLYAFTRQLGRTIVTISPGTVEWQNRADWPGPVSQTWLAEREPLQS